jgi:PAS domain S-box-containing protein
MMDGFALHEIVLNDKGKPVDYIFLEVNSAFEHLTGLKRENMIGEKVTEVLPGIETDPADWIGKYGEVTLTGREIRIEQYSQPLEKWYSVLAFNPRKGQFATIFEDITERKKAEEALAQYATRLEAEVQEHTRQLREAQEQLVRQERLAMLGQLAGSIGHELRNPLGVITNAVYYLKMAQPDVNVTVREYLDIIENETRTSDKIVTDLLDFTRIKSLDPEPASVPELVGQTLQRFPVPQTMTVSLKLPKRLPQIYADPHHIVQILGNLVTNAYQAMTDGGKLTISAAAQSGMMKIAVRDTGEGIPPENMNKLFEPLFTTKARGIGLGLAVSRKLAEANGGRIEVQSVPGKGSTFTLYMPVYSL